jgi:hypothetical protein
MNYKLNLFLATLVPSNVVHFGVCAADPAFLRLLEAPLKQLFWNFMYDIYRLLLNVFGIPEKSPS